MQLKKGFTIIELIVVIAIIAILAAIVLVNVTQYINKSKDAAVQGNMSSIQTAAAACFSDTSGCAGNYLTFNGGTATGYTTSFSTMNTAVHGADTGTITQGWSSSAYCYSIPLVANTSNKWCIDSTGYAGGKACVAANFDCE